MTNLIHSPTSLDPSPNSLIFTVPPNKATVIGCQGTTGRQKRGQKVCTNIRYMRGQLTSFIYILLTQRWTDGPVKLEPPSPYPNIHPPPLQIHEREGDGSVKGASQTPFSYVSEQEDVPRMHADNGNPTLPPQQGTSSCSQPAPLLTLH